MITTIQKLGIRSAPTPVREARRLRDIVLELQLRSILSASAATDIVRGDMSKGYDAKEEGKTGWISLESGARTCPNVQEVTR